MALKKIANSVYFEKGGSDHLTRTPGAATSTTTWTASFWFRRSRNIVANIAETIWSAGSDATNYTSLEFDAGNHLKFIHVEAGTPTFEYVAAQSYEDPTTWAHVVVRFDSTEVVSTDRLRIWFNNIPVTDFTTETVVGASASSDLLSTQAHSIGRRQGPNDQLYDGYLADFYLCDGQALSPTDFGEVDTPAWQPIVATPTFGAEGFFLENGTASALGDDTSGNVNDWTTSGLGTGNQRNDTPASPYVLWNQQYFGTGDTVSLREGARHLTAANTVYVAAGATHPLPQTGKYYWEVVWGATSGGGVDKVCVGIMTQAADLNGRVGDDNHGWGLYNPSGTVVAVRHDGADTNFTDTAAFAVADVYNIAYDADSGKLWFGLDGTWFDSGNPATGANPAVTLTAADILGNVVIPAGSLVTTNNRLDISPTAEDQVDTVPTGFKTLDISTWGKPPITDPTLYMEVFAYVGSGASPRTFTGLNFQPGFVWVKNNNRDPSNHIMTNTVVGAGSVWLGDLNNQDTPGNLHGEIATLTSDGFSVQKNITDLGVNALTDNFISISFKEDPVAGFDIVGYVGTAGAQAIAHSLGEVPDYMYVRNRDAGGNNTMVYHGHRLTSGEIVADPQTDYLEANTNLAATDLATPWNDVAPTTTQFTVGTHTSSNSSGADHMAHLWTEVEGFSKFTSYIGTGSTDEEAPFIYLGFRPKLVLFKRTNTTEDWILLISDDSRSALSNVAAGGTRMSGYLVANEDSDLEVPIGNPAIQCGSGIKLEQSISSFNALGSEYLVMAWAEAPMNLLSSFSTEKFGAGAIVMDLEIDATGDDPNQYGDGAPELGYLISGSGTGGKPKGAGAIELIFQNDATASAPVFRHGDSAVSLPFEISAQGFNTAMRSDFELPLLTSNGAAVQSFDSQGTVTLPQLTTNGTMPQAIVLTGNLILPAVQVNAAFDTRWEFILPSLTANGTILAGATARAPAIPLPVLQTVATGISPIITIGSVRLPRLGVDATVAGGSVITSGGVLTGPAVALPTPEANGFLLVPQEMAGFITLPTLDVGPLSLLAPGAIVTASVTLPLLRTTSSILVNGVSLTATVWSMNTETLESTNYLNYDFVGLVSFADRPYGVTATGIFLLEGDDDAGTNIDARILTGISDRGIESLKEVAQMYMQYDGGAMMFQLFPDGQQSLREYRFDRRSNSSGVIHARAKGSRGLRSRSFQMGLRNLSGQAFTLDKLGLLERILTRKTGKN